MSDVQTVAWPSLLVATTNVGKLREISAALAGLPVTLLTLADLAALPDEPDETGATFAENAALKALAYAGASHLPTVAEDSGLSIDALDGRPGIHSARYPGATYPDKISRLLAELAPHARPWRARFVSAVALAMPGDPPRLLYIGSGTVEGEITEPTGTQGFGYDPIFLYPPYGTTLGNVDEAHKMAISHRGTAFRQFRDWLEQQASVPTGSIGHPLTG
jgi:XTP/dITP diphosphohydrolase